MPLDPEYAEQQLPSKFARNEVVNFEVVVDDSIRAKSL